MTDSNEIIFLVDSSSEGGYEARALSASIFTEADTIDELKMMIRDAVECHFEEDNRPEIIRLHFVREDVFAPVRVPRDLSGDELFADRSKRITQTNGELTSETQNSHSPRLRHEPGRRSGPGL